MNSRPIDLSPFGHLYPFASHFLDRHGFSYHYLDEGVDEPILMVHGNPTWSFYFRGLIKGLRPHYRTIVPDHLGCGLSDKPPASHYGYRLQDRVADLKALIQHLELTGGLTLLVHDWGGAIGLGLAVRRPAWISRLIILNTAAFRPTWAKKIPNSLRLIRDFEFLAKPAVQGLNLFARTALFLASTRGLSRQVRAGLLAPYNSWANRLAILKFVQDIPLKPGDASYRLLAEIDEGLAGLTHLPILICWGGRDFVFTRDFLAEWRRRFPLAEVHEFDEAGHYLLEDRPKEVLAVIGRFLEKNPIPRP